MVYIVESVLKFVGKKAMDVVRHNVGTTKKNKKLWWNTSMLMLVFAAIAIYFAKGQIDLFLKIFFIQFASALGFFVLVLLIAFTKMREQKGDKYIKGYYEVSKEEDNGNKPLYKLRSLSEQTASHTRKVVPLEDKNFNWKDEEIVRSAADVWQHKKPQKKEEQGKKEFMPYRSPFDPINPANKEDNINAKRHSEQEQKDVELEDSLEDATLLEMHRMFEEEDRQEKQEREEAYEDNKCQLSPLADLLYTDESDRSVSINQLKNNIWMYPPIGLLADSDSQISEDELLNEIDKNVALLENTLHSFKIEAKIIDVSIGPSVTRYEIQPKVGVKVSKIVNLADDIALNLAAKDVRIEAPIPGKAAVGIEVPNKKVMPVFLKEVIDNNEFTKDSSPIIFGLGKDITGNNIVVDISKMPHLLIAGATGSGKSVCINTLITSLIYKATPEQVRVLLIDPKVVELGIYNGIPHLLIPVVTDAKKAAAALGWAVQEMTRRYQLFAENNVRDLKGFNALVEEGFIQEEKLAQIVIIIDELADLMMVAANEAEDAICRLAQMARAAGMHLVIATQRPSVDVITGVIKANIPSRISFAVSSQVDSRTILDMAGAEKLLGNGDMLFSPMGQSKPLRVQGAFISEKEVEKIVSHIKRNVKAEYQQEVLESIKSQVEPNKEVMQEEDELLEDAVEVALERGQASASLIQRKFRVGYARAARILDQMEALGIVSSHEGSKPREVLITKEVWEEMKL